MNKTTNPQLDLAREFVEFTGKHVFLTGKAGTGKTTFLHQLKADSPKRMIVVAPTGVAAINAGGVTIHSFFQLPFGPIIPGYGKNSKNADQQAQYRRFSKLKKNIIKSLDLLVIDEISMVRSDMLDGIDETLRRFRNNQDPFGGVQLLLIGDMQQLAPVIRDEEWNILREHYDTVFFFSSKALKQTSYVNIELTHVYRQSDTKFIKLLNQIRDNQLTDDVLALLNSRYQPSFEKTDGYITLTTHNAKASHINHAKLSQLPGTGSKYRAEVEGNFPEYSYPTDFELVLKEGAQVMFVKNDPSPEKEYFNGKIGKITNIDENSIEIQCPDDQDPIYVEPIEWQNYKYSMDEETKEITETVEGTFTQLPLKLAWAITIHKSQGLTFEKAIVDANAAFAFGQVYVALSRCRSLEGLVLSSRIEPNSMKSSHIISRFNQYIEENQPGEQQLHQSVKEYQLMLLLDLFSFTDLNMCLNILLKIAQNHQKVLSGNLLNKLELIRENFREKILRISTKFHLQINSYFQACNNIEEYPLIQDRVKKAVNYFSKHLVALISDPILELNIESDNKELKKKLTEGMKYTYQETMFKKNCLDTCQYGFVLKTYLNKKAKASLESYTLKPPKAKKGQLTSEVRNKELYDILRSWRKYKAEEIQCLPYQVFHQKTLYELSEKIPGTPKALKAIHGLGKKKMEQFGVELLEVINDYRIDQGLEVAPHDEPDEKESKPKPNTREITLNLWKTGLGIAEIAREREMAFSTISQHLTHWVEKGVIPVEDLVDGDKVEKIRAYYLNNKPQGMKEVKEAFGDEVSYTDIRFVLGGMRFEGLV